MATASRSSCSRPRSKHGDLPRRPATGQPPGSASTMSTSGEWLPALRSRSARPSKSPEADDTAAECEEGFVDLGAAVVANEQPLEMVQPGEGALDNPASAPEAGAVLGLATGDLWCDPVATELEPVLANAAAHRRDPLKKRDQLGWPRCDDRPVSVQASGIPVASTRRWCFDSVLALSTGLGPVSEPLSPARGSSRPPRATTRSPPPAAARRAEARAVAPTPQPAATRPGAGSRSTRSRSRARGATAIGTLPA